MSAVMEAPPEVREPLKWSEQSIGHALCHGFLQRKCIVLVPNTTWTGYECDVLGVTMDQRIIDIEIKISRADLKADAAKSKWWRSPSFEQAKALGLIKEGDDVRWHPWDHKVHYEWPHKVWKHYYALPKDIWKPELMETLGSPRSGVLLLSDDRRGKLQVECERRATPNKDADKLTPAQTLDIARLANLRMWQ